MLVADDQALVRMGLRVLVEAEQDLELVGEPRTVEAVELARRTRPNVVLMDVGMPGTDGIAALREIVADSALTETRVVVLTTFELDEYVFESLARAVSCSRTPPRPSCCARSTSSPPGSRCSRPLSRAG